MLSGSPLFVRAFDSLRNDINYQLRFDTATANIGPIAPIVCRRSLFSTATTICNLRLTTEQL